VNSCQILIKLESPRQIFGKYSHIKFRENLSRGSRAVPCGRTNGQTDRQTDMTKLIVAVRNSANAPNISSVITNKLAAEPV